MKLYPVLLFALLALGFKANAASNTVGSQGVADTLKKAKNYYLFTKTSNIETLNFSKSKKPENVVIIKFGYYTPMPNSNAMAGVVQSNKQLTVDELPVFDNIEATKGKFGDFKLTRDTKTRNLLTINNVEYPVHLKLTSGKEIIEFELLEAGTWNINVEFKNN